MDLQKINGELHMRAYQIKIILKNSKPPVWRRCLIPAGITFSQLALILEDVVESERCAGYEYEFYQAGVRVREWKEGERQAATYYYDFQCASDTFIDSLADKEAKNSLAEKIRDEILKPEVMAKRMLLLSDAEIREFEKAVAKENGYYPDRKEMENLEKLYNLTYVMLYSDDYAEVPREAAEIYRTINTPAYQEERRGTYWLYHCLMMVDLLYACAPAAIVCRMMKKCLGRKVERAELESLWANIPDELNPCILLEDKVIVKEALKDNVYLRIEASQGDKKFYIPSSDEIVEYTENGYPVSDPYYSRLKTFFIEELDMDLDKSEEYMPAIWNRVSMGNSLADIMEMLGGQGIVFPSEKAMRKFVSLMTDVNNHTRMLSNRGWTPNEMLRQMPAAPDGRKPAIVPMSSEAARLLGEAADELKERGFDVDLDYNADEITTMSMPDGISGRTVVGKKKIYPNDPCPCGSGKKYKKCCGRKK